MKNTRTKKIESKKRVKNVKRLTVTPIPDEEIHLNEFTGEINRHRKENLSETDGDVSFTRSGKPRTHSDRGNVQNTSKPSKNSSNSLNVEDEDNEAVDLMCNEIIQFDDPKINQKFIDFLNDDT